MRLGLVLAVFVVSASLAPASAQTGAEVGRLLRDLESRDFDRAHAAAEKLREHPAARARSVPALIKALSARDWDRCSADARDAIARTLAALKAREAVTPLLDLVTSGKPIDHECFECGCCLLAVTPADELGARAFDPFGSTGVLSAINELADGTHSKALADLIVASGKGRAELLITLGRVGAPRYANFIGRSKDDPDASIRRGVAMALGLIDNETVSVPVLVQLVARGGGPETFGVRWDAAESLVRIAKRGSTDAARRRLNDDHLGVRACAVYALGRIAGTSAERQLRESVQAALEYERLLEARKLRGESEATLRERHGLGEYDLRETLQQALTSP